MIPEKRKGDYLDLGELGGHTGGDLGHLQAGEFLSQGSDSSGQVGGVLLSELSRLVLLGVHLAL